MYLLVIAWIYVVLMMSVAEATSTSGTVLGAVVTFVMYGLGPVALVVYLMRAPARNRALKKRHAEEWAQHNAVASAAPELQAQQVAAFSDSPDGSSHATSRPETVAASASVASVREKP